jgi:succinyl-CoA synthetase beta subunit
VLSVAPVDVETAGELATEAGLASHAADVAAALVAVGRAAVEHPEIAEIDINPLILTGEGAVAVDALVVLDRGGTA